MPWPQDAIPEITVTEDELEPPPPCISLELEELLVDSRPGGEESISLDMDELPIPPVLRVEWADLPQLVEDIAVAEDELAPVLVVGLADLPEDLILGLADLPPDLTNTCIECYHGTSWEAAEKIRTGGFQVGAGNAYGSGAYFAVGGVGIAPGFVKSSRPCIIRARVAWGNVLYLDDPHAPPSCKGAGDAVTQAAKALGYDSFLTMRDYSAQSPAIGIVLGIVGSIIPAPRIEVMELIDPASPRLRA